MENAVSKLAGSISMISNRWKKSEEEVCCMQAHAHNSVILFLYITSWQYNFRYFIISGVRKKKKVLSEHLYNLTFSCLAHNGLVSPTNKVILKGGYSNNLHFTVWTLKFTPPHCLFCQGLKWSYCEISLHVNLKCRSHSALTCLVDMCSTPRMPSCGLAQSTSL